MSTDNATIARDRGLRTTAVVMASLVVVAPLVASRVIEWIVKSLNPDRVDVSQGLAYLGPLLITGFVLLAVMFVATLVVIVVLQRRDPAGARLPWLVLGIQAVFVVVWLLAGLAVNAVTGA